MIVNRVHLPKAKEQASYFYKKNHLSNICEVVDETGKVLQANNYYPFGMPYTDNPNDNASLQKYKYNGKELDLVHGLNTYDYGARQYNPVIPSWDRVDPLGEKYYNISPYVYCGNNPVNNIDTKGEKITHYLQLWQKGKERNGHIVLTNMNMQYVKDAYNIFNQTTNGSTILSSFKNGANKRYELMLVTGHYMSDKQKKLADVDPSIMGSSTIGFDDENNILQFIVYVDDSFRSVGEILETIIHEFSDHMSFSKIRSCINIFEKYGKGVGGFEKASNFFYNISAGEEHLMQKRGEGEPGLLYRSYVNEIQKKYPQYVKYFK